MSIRNGIPPFIDIPAAWTGEELSKSPELWRRTLNASEISELITAAKNLEGVVLHSIDAGRFALPTLGPKIRKLRETLIHGKGFWLISGLPIDEIGAQVSSIIFCGIGAHLGFARPQNAAGDLLGHVRDFGADGKDPNTRIYQTRERQTFHTDSADVVGLMCLNEAREGGISMLVSAVSIFNEFSRERPDLLPFLFEPIATDRRGEVPEGEKPFFRIPVFSWHQGSLTVMYQRQYIDSAQRFPDAPRLTEKHVEALDFFDKLADDPRLHLKMHLRPGDIQFVYNHSLLHDRTAFVDWPEAKKKRHLLRLWLSIPGDRILPDCFKERYGTVDIGNRGGIVD